MSEPQKLSEGIRIKYFILDEAVEPVYPHELREMLKKIEALEAELSESQKELEDWKTQRAPRAMLAGEIIRQDWSGHQFDGRSVRTWIREALAGDYVQFDKNLKWFDEEYGCTLDDAKKELAEAAEKMTLRGGEDEK